MEGLKNFDQFISESSVVNDGQDLELNESAMDIINGLTELLNSKDVISIAGEAVEKGLAVKAMLATLLGLPSVGVIGTKIQGWLKGKDPKKALTLIKDAKKESSL